MARIQTFYLDNMCTNPILLTKRSSVRSDRVTALRVITNEHEDGSRDYKVYKKLRASSMDYFYNKCIVPCGKCSECLSKRQADLAARCAAEARKRGSMGFLTLTYSDEFLPIAVLLQKIDKETGDIIADCSLNLLDRPKRRKKTKTYQRKGIKYKTTRTWFEYPPGVLSERVNCLRSFNSIPYGVTKFYERDFLEDDRYLYRYHFTPSLCSRDVRLWLMRARVIYERKFGEKLPEFTYVVCGEYGSKNKRPHYHLGLFGLQKKHVDFLASLWEYGFTYVEMVNCVNADGSDGFAAASKYIGKYMSKGEFECPAVKDGFAVKGRLASSKGLGDTLPDALVSYYRCYDIIGVYDINKPLENEQLQVILPILRQRNSIIIGKSVFLLPRKYRNQIWSIKTSHGFSASVVRRQISDAISSNFINDYFQRYKELYPGKSFHELYKMASDSYKTSVYSAALKNDIGKQYHQKFYLTSKF